MIGFITPGQDMTPMQTSRVEAGAPPGGPTTPDPPPGPKLPDPPPDLPLPDPPRRPEDPQPIVKEPPAIPPEVPSPIGDPLPDVPSLPGPGRRNPGIGTARHGWFQRIHAHKGREHRQILCING